MLSKARFASKMQGVVLCRKTVENTVAVGLMAKHVLPQSMDVRLLKSVNQKAGAVFPEEIAP